MEAILAAKNEKCCTDCTINANVDPENNSRLGGTWVLQDGDVVSANVN